MSLQRSVPLQILDYRRAAVAVSVAYGLALATFALWPGIDLAVSGWFYRPGEGFWLAADARLALVRAVIWNLSTAVAVGAAIALILAALRRPIPGFEARRAGFVFLLYAVGPGLIVNGLLKRYWGRARPADIVEFGGTRTFTPPWLPAHECSVNCSFVSGEGSAAAALMIVALGFVPYLRRRLPGWAFRVYLAFAVLVPLTGIALRIVTGRHFLSDTVFAVLLVVTIALLLHRLLLAGRRG
jgi:lipid A 4'-phosphatase